MDLHPGMSGSAELLVGEEHTAPRIGSGKVRVLATPVMINLIEAAALAAVEHLLPAGTQSLGTHLDVHHVAVFLDELDGGHEAVALQPVLVEVARFHVGGEHQRHAALQQGAEQAGEDHGVGDVGHEQFVEADDLGLLRDLVGHAVERRLHALEALQVRVHLLHEAVEVRAALLGDAQGRKEQVHEPGLAAAHAAP